ncbi:MurR/RpiR family transcriptional regulator [Pediococcus pentosaceus]|uniref:MurR/RpiR family transcriptional regulator n=1 Tax=Pediococcus pentosaceus TaxID=1255 RepID=UPI00338D77CA
MANFNLRLQAYQANFSDKEKELAQFLLKNQAQTTQLTISELSHRTNISTATISRFAKNLGFDNFQALKLCIAQNIETNNPYVEISPADSPKTMAKKIFKLNVDTLNATENALNGKDLDQCVNLILNTKKLGLFGLGASNIVALNGFHKFLRTTIEPIYASDFHMQLMEAARLSKNDVVLLVSHSGENRDALALAEVAKERNIPLILITSSANSTLSKKADVTLVSVAEESLYRPDALHALIAQISIMDTLFMMIAIKTKRNIATNIRHEIDKTRNRQ